MTPTEYMKLCQRTKGPMAVKVNRDNEDLLHAAIGMCTEAGEIQDAIKKHLFYGQDLDIKNIREELGDVLWYISIALTHLEWSFEEIMQENIDKLKLRYPQKFTQQAAMFRADKRTEQISCQDCGKVYPVGELCPVCNF